MSVADRIKAARKRARLTQPQLAALVGVSKGAVGQWESGSTEPNGKNLTMLSAILGVTAEHITSGAPDTAVNNTSPAEIKGWIPLISYVQAGEWAEAIDLYEPGFAEQVLPTTVPHSMSTFALRVEGDSMTKPEGVRGPSFPDGMIIYVDPERVAEKGDFVVAKHNGNQKVTFKQLATEEGRPVLMPLNPDRKQYPVIRDEFEIIGRVIDASWGGL